MSLAAQKQYITSCFGQIQNQQAAHTPQVLLQTQIAALLADIERLQRTEQTKDAEIVAMEQRLRDWLFEQGLLMQSEQLDAKTSEKDRVSSEEHPQQSLEMDQDDITTLRNRLMNNHHNQFDSIDMENSHHDTLQSELIESLPSMVTAIKDQALQFQEMIQHDASILKDVTNKFEISNGKFDTVNDALNKYHKEGKLGLWLYVRLAVGVFVAFFFLLALIRLIPAR